VAGSQAHGGLGDIIVAMTKGDDATVAGPAPLTAETALAGADLVGGRYRIVRWLGGGGMGRVYEALDTELELKVALKVLNAATAGEALERFRNEVRLTRQIQHRNVARMYDIGVHEGQRFLTLEMIEGDPLTRELGRGPMPWARLAPIAEQICAGLAAAHAVGIVHRDLKPDNVLVERAGGRVVITDFGIARRDTDAGLTQVGTVVGTPRYMAPEQLAGRDLDARADLFSLGVMMYELASDARPWDGDNAIAIAVAQATTAPEPLRAPHLPAAAAALIMKCLALEPAERPASADELRAAIAAVSVGAAPPRAASPAPEPPRAPPVRAAPKDATLAVLPLACAPDDRYLADGVFEDLIDTLSTTSRLRVRPAGSVLAVTDVDPREVGKKLEVDQVVAGSLRRLPFGLRVTARLISVEDGFQIWSQRTDCTEAEVLVVSQQLAKGIAAALSTRSTVATRPTDPRAVDLYLRARAELRRFWASHARDASELLGEALELAPTSPQIAGAFAYAAVQAWVLSGDPALLARAEVAVARGLATGHGDAYLGSAVLRMNQNDLVGGAGDLGRSLVLAPMSGSAHEAAARILCEVASFDVARHHYETARGLEPLRGKVIETELARLDALSGDIASADRRIADIAADADASIAQLGDVFSVRFAAWRGDVAGAIAASERVASGVSAPAERMIRFVRESLVRGALDEATWKRLVEGQIAGAPPGRLRLLGIQIIAEVAALVGDVPHALAALESANENGLIDVNWLDRCRIFTRLATEPRWRKVRADVGARAQAVLAAFEQANGPT
jgi:serine/threonine-protein kinase